MTPRASPAIVRAPLFPVALLALDLAGATPTLEPLRIAEPPTVDGRLDEEAWTRAPMSDHFTQRETEPGHPPSEPTRVRVLYDDHDLYVGIDCEQRGAPISRRLTRRDREISTDIVQVNLDTRDDGVSAVYFQVTAAGVLLDGIRYDDTASSISWDENWEAGTAVTPTGWSAEYRIPLRVLRFEPSPGQTWGMQVRRFTSAREELDEWAFIGPTVAGEVSRYGRLGPFTGLPRQGGIELRPFVAAWVRHRDAEEGLLARGFDESGQVGLDAKWHLGQDLTLDLTFAPDFGQVEADQVVLNLGTFETLFEEKRAFFLEGLDVLATPVSLVYTRRIGAAPDVPELREDARHREALVDAPEPSTILGAGKLTGHIGRLTIGALSAVTAPNEVDVRTSTGDVRRLVDPATVFQVLRLKEELGANAHVGLLAGMTLRMEGEHAPVVSTRTDPQVRRLCPDGTETGAETDCFRDAFVGGIDGRFRSGDWVAQGQVVASVVRGGTDRELRDGTVVGPGDASAGANLRVAKEGGQHWLGFVQYQAFGERLALNDLGYLERQNRHYVFANWGYQETEPTGPFLFAQTALEAYGNWNMDGLHGARGVQLYGFGKLRNRLFLFSELRYRPRSFDDREVGEGTALEREGLVALEAYAETSGSAPAGLEVSITLQRPWNGFIVDGGFALIYRGIPALDLRLETTALYTDGEPRFVDDVDAAGNPVFAEQRAEQLSVTLRATWTFTPRLTLQVYGQLFAATIDYHHFLRDGTPSPGGRVSLADLEDGPAPAENPDEQEVDLNMSVVLRWEWSLGAYLWLVYSRAQEATPTLTPETSPVLDPGVLSRGRATDVLLFKLSWWWG